MDYLEEDQDVDLGKVIVMGYLCFGKMVFWVGVMD